MKTILSLFLYTALAFSAQSQSLCKYYLDLSQHYTYEKDFEKAHFYVEKAIKMYPDTARCYLMRGGAYFFSDNFEDALTDLDKFIGMAPSDPEGYFWRGYTLFALELYDVAEQDFLSYLNMDPSSVEMRFKLAETYYKQGRIDKAKSQFSEVLIEDQSNVHSYNYLGLIAEQENDYELSIEYYTKGMELDQTYTPLYYNRGRVNTFAGNKDAACQDLNVALELGVEDASIWIDGNNCEGLTGLSQADKNTDKQERFKGKKSEVSTFNVTSNYFPMRSHSRYIFKSETDGKIDTAAINVIFDHTTKNDYYLDFWNVKESDIPPLFFQLLHTGDFRSTNDSLMLLLRSSNSELVPIPLFPYEFTIGEEVIIENSWNPKPMYEMINAAVSLEGVETVYMPNGDKKECIKLRIEIRENNGRDELSYLWFVKDFGLVKWRKSTGKVWEIIRYAVQDYGSFPEEEHIHLLPPSRDIIMEEVIRTKQK